MEAKAWQVCSVLAKVKGEREEDLEVVSSFIFSAKMGKKYWLHTGPSKKTFFQRFFFKNLCNLGYVAEFNTKTLL